MRKTLYTLDVGGYAPRLTRLTMPLLRHHAAKMGADLVVISDRLYPDWPVGVEKLQVYYLSRLREDDWSVYLDADALVHPDCPDWTNHIAPDTVANNSFDFAAARFRYDSYFMRDGRNVGCGSWCVVASSWCRDLWRPPDDLTPDEAVANISPTLAEIHAGIKASHLVDGYLMSRNIARFGLKATSLTAVQKGLGMSHFEWLWHDYAVTDQQKEAGMLAKLDEWKVPASLRGDA